MGARELGVYCSSPWPIMPAWPSSPRKPEIAKLTLPPILLGLRDGEPAKPQERGKSLKGQSFCQTRAPCFPGQSCLLHLCQITHPVLHPSRDQGSQGLSEKTNILEGGRSWGGNVLRLICEG